MAQALKWNVFNNTILGACSCAIMGISNTTRAIHYYKPWGSEFQKDGSFAVVPYLALLPIDIKPHLHLFRSWHSARYIQICFFEFDLLPANGLSSWVTRKFSLHCPMVTKVWLRYPVGVQTFLGCGHHKGCFLLLWIPSQTGVLHRLSSWKSDWPHKFTVPLGEWEVCLLG
jgi:hypothetical protein